uniref:Uncharacterized protein n=1 Tax=Peronospora matthiolae TaxID=2874970 RepID=A0AAV1TWV3_9STRA
MSKISRSQAEQKQTQLDASRQFPPVEEACPAHARGRRATQGLRDQRSSREHTDPHDRVESVFPPPPPPLEDSRGGQRYLVRAAVEPPRCERTSDELSRPVARLSPILGYLGAPLPTDDRRTGSG